MEWTPSNIDHSVDDPLYFSSEKEADNAEVWPFDQSFYLIINAAVGGGWGGQQGIDTTILPQKYYVDYVRVYQK